MNALEIINKCIEKIEDMTQEEFEFIALKKNINGIEYDTNKYVGGGFKVELPGDNNEGEAIRINIIQRYVNNKLMLCNNKTVFTNEYVCNSWDTIDYIDTHSEFKKMDALNYINNVMREQKNVSGNVKKNNHNFKNSNFNGIDDNCSEAA